MSSLVFRACGQRASAFLILFLSCFSLLLAPLAHAQPQDTTALEELDARWAAQIDRADRMLELESVRSEEIDALRGELAEQRSEALSRQDAARARVAKLRADLEALGPAPAEGEAEASAVTERRSEINSELKLAQAELLAAESAYSDTEDALDRIDTRVRTQFSNRLIALGPSPVLPQRWPPALSAMFDYFTTLEGEARSTLDSRFARDRLMQRLPFAGLLIFVGLVLLFGIRQRLVGWVESFLKIDQRAKSGAWAGAILNLARLAVPTFGAGALIAGLDTLGLFRSTGQVVIDALPACATILILAYWVGHSVFAPRLAQFRLIRIEDSVARTGARWTMTLGFFTALHLLLMNILEEQDATAEIASVLMFPIIVFAAVSLWRLAAIFRISLLKPEAVESEDDSTTSEALGVNLIRISRRIAVFVAVICPVLAAVGYTALAEYFLFSVTLSIGLAGGAFVVFATFLKVLEALFTSPQEESSAKDPYGLLPVIGGFLILLVCLPILALIWGARQSDLVEIWVWLRDGVSIGGSRISLTDFLALVVVFAIGYTLTRFLQSVLRRTVMPRTRLDVGGQNAVTTGVGYLGIFLAALVAITATGLDLSNLAIVAGALSVGVGFGLQTIVSNFVSGIILLIERPIKQGDWIEVAGYSGYVRKISVRSTEIETFDRSNVIVPNQELIAGTVLNYTHGSMNGRVIVPVGVAYGSDARKVESILREVAEGHPLVLRRPPPGVIFMGFGADSLDFEIRAILRDVNYMLSVKSEMNFEIYKRFAEEGIEIPFAQRDINLRNPQDIASALKAFRQEES